MVFALGTLRHAKHLCDHGVLNDRAETHAEAVAELVTKIDLEAALDRVTLRMTVGFGVMLVARVGVLAALQKLS
jgi:hypothetical protein